MPRYHPGLGCGVVGLVQPRLRRHRPPRACPPRRCATRTCWPSPAAPSPRSPARSACAPTTTRSRSSGTARCELEADHSVAGNPMRFETGTLHLRRDDAWRRQLADRDRRVVTALTAPLLARYGYLGRRAS